MSDTVTVNYGWTKPEVGASGTTWGTKLNNDLDLIDAQVFSNQNAVNALNVRYTANTLLLNKPTVDAGAFITAQMGGVDRWQINLGDGAAETGSNSGSNFSIVRYSDTGAIIDTPLAINRANGRIQVTNSPLAATDAVNKSYADMLAPVGAVINWPGVTLPPGWTWLLGQSLSTAQFPALFTVLGYRYGGSGSTFNLPNAAGRTIVGYDGSGWQMGATGGEVNHTLSYNELPVHNHGVNDPTHAHGASQDPHNHQVPNTVVPGGGLTPGGVADSLGNSTSSTAQPNVYVAAAATNISIQNAGGGAAHNNMQPYLVLGMIIRLQ